MTFNTNQIINNRYQLLQFIGFGSFGEVWLAKDNVLDMNIAIKIYVALDSRGFNEFKQEFRTAYSLCHPNLLCADYFDSVGRNPYLVMPFCPESAGNKTGKMDEKELWKFIYDVSAGLEYLHTNDVIHRDIKPDNILRNEHGVYVIADFGLSTKMRSTLRKASARKNDANKNEGTIGYMAPEMFAASPQAVKATDIWAFGATLFELATGDLPFCGQGGVMETYGAEIPDIPNLHDTSLLNLIQQCLAKETWDRPTAHSIHLQAAKEIGNVNSIDDASNKQYLNQIRKLEEDIKRLKKNKNSGSGKSFMYLFFITLLVLCISIAAFVFYNNTKKNEYEGRIDTMNERLLSAHNVINNIQGIIDNHTLSNEETFSDWTSSNHEHNSEGTREYIFEATVGDKLSFDYDVDSEKKFDIFICYICHNEDETEIKNVSGKERGVIRYTIQSDGNYELKLLYKKDGTIHSGRDNVRISNIRLERCMEGKIKRLLHDYKQQEAYAFENADTICIQKISEDLDSIEINTE